MLRILLIVATTILTSFYLFPFEFKALPGANTKMILAAFGVVLLVIELSKGEKGVIRKDLVPVVVASLVVSLCGLFSVVINSTHDYTYATYFISFAVWLSASYVVVSVIKYVHSAVSVVILTRYLAAVCVCQCILALIIDNSPVFAEFLQSFIGGFGMEATMESMSGNRLYGIGAALDVAGTRFAAVSILLSYVISRKDNTKMDYFIYGFSLLVLLLIGNMISRTTSIGIIIGLILIILSRFFYETDRKTRSKVRKTFSIGFIVLVPIVVALYRSDERFRYNLRFGFEGFFSLAEHGRWEVSSNEKLATMYVFPDNTKTWIIGDGYFEGQKNDPYYVGEDWVLFYKGTDVGYLRFIFYFGLIGLLSFMLFFVLVSSNCVKRFPDLKWMFVLLLFLNYVIWLKVATDIFVIFAPFLCLTDGDETSIRTDHDLNSNCH